MTAIVGLSGFAQSGKDTTGSILVDQYGFRRIAFADKMKEFAEGLDPIVDFYQSTYHSCRPVRLSEMLAAVGWERAKENREVRRLLQCLGTDAGRAVLGDTIWVDAAFAGIGPGERIVFTDVRFPNEALAIQKANGIVVRVHRPGVFAPNDHISEHALADWRFDYELYNDGDLFTLAARVEHLLDWASERAA